MRDLLTIFLIGIVTLTYGQKVSGDMNFPFQVIYAENVENNKGQSLKELDLISVDDVLTIKAGGFLSMIHYFGFPLEIIGDTTIKVEDVHFLLDNAKGRKKRKKYAFTARPNIDYLFLSDPKYARKNKLSATGACFDCNLDLEIIYPPRYSSRHIYYTGDLCLTWQNTDATGYEIEFLNIYGESLKTYKSSTNSLRVDAAELKGLILDENPLMLRTKDLTTNKFSDFSFLREFNIDNLDSPYTCTLNKPTFALLTGFFLEMSPHNYIDEAEKYFKLATELSDKVFYRTMFENFKKRRE